jgi:GR25 family glycosyltransferase involved in LPS biosynthesis
MSTLKGFCINLERRTDRKEKFLNLLEQFGPKDLDIEFIQAVDGSSVDLSKHEFRSLISDENDFNSDPKIIATTLSHLNTLSKIASSNIPGIVFEDDVQFREDGLIPYIWTDYSKNLVEFFKKNEKSIVYLGTGDVLPVHTGITSEHMLRAQERYHITGPVINKYFARPKDKSIYIFDWMGAFSYCVSSETAKFLLEHFKENKIHKAFDVTLKDTLKSRFVSVPLICYHPDYEVRDSDIRSN